jgi:hypothetical protein
MISGFLSVCVFKSYYSDINCFIENETGKYYFNSLRYKI